MDTITWEVSARSQQSCPSQIPPSLESHTYLQSRSNTSLTLQSNVIALIAQDGRNIPTASHCRYKHSKIPNRESSAIPNQNQSDDGDYGLDHNDNSPLPRTVADGSHADAKDEGRNTRRCCETLREANGEAHSPDHYGEEVGYRVGGDCGADEHEGATEK